MPEHGSGTPCIYLQPAVSQHNLAAAALQKGGQLQGLHGLHGRNAGSQSGLEVLSPAHRWWVVDVYSDDIRDDLKTSLIKEYFNEMPLSDGEIYR
ncbi:hypothetical protein RJ035_004619 [Blastomyces gilchristii]